MPRNSIIWVSLVALCATPAWAQGGADVKQSVSGSLRVIAEAEISEFVNLEGASIENELAARALILKTAGGVYPAFPVDDDAFHCIIHVLRWSNSDPQQPGKQNWYTYHRGWDNARMAGRRVFGSKNVWLLIVHINSNSDYELQYDITIKPKVAANIANLLAIGQLFPGVKGLVPVAAPMVKWRIAKLDVRDVPSAIEVDAKVSAAVALALADGTAVTADPPVVKTTQVDKAQAFTNEGRYLWDVGIGVPIRSIKQLKKNDTDEIVTAEKQDRSSVLALLSVYPIPVDLSAKTPPPLPHLSVGFDISERPTRRVFVGGGMGLPFLDIYAGGMRVAQPAVNNSGSDLVKWQWTVGLMVPARRLAEVLK
jgi:hypothetical protein